MVIADLHVHTTASDGSLTISEIVDIAHRVGICAVGITDHDTPHPDLDDPIVDHAGITIVHGIELRVEVRRDRQVDLLGYGLVRTPSLEALVERLQDDRINRGNIMIDKVEDHLGIDLDIAVTSGFGRPHVARAIARHPGTPFDYESAFANVIGSDGPCYVPRTIPSFEVGVTVLQESCKLVGLAHPFRYHDPPAALALTRDLDAVERWYPYDRSVDTTIVDQVIEENGLVPTGGSDAHDERIGSAGMDVVAYNVFTASCGFPRTDACGDAT